MAFFRCRIRDGVIIREQRNCCYLVSGYPLNAVRIATQWAGFLRELNKNPGGELPAYPGGGAKAGRAEVEEFCRALIKRGFLEEVPSPDGKGAPAMSVIIPVRNRPQDIEACLQSLKAACGPEKDMQVIVVDDASEDNTAEVASRLGAEVLRNKNQKGASHSRNRGAAVANGEILCFLDSDCQADPNWLVELASAFGHEKAAACGGLVDSISLDTALDRYEQVKSSLRMGDRPGDSTSQGDFFYVPSCNFAVRKDVFQSLGGFNVEMDVGEDVDLCWRIVDQEWVVKYHPGARVGHRHRNRIAPFCARRFAYGTSEPLLQKKHRSRRKQIPLRTAALSFWALVVGSLFMGPFWAAAAMALMGCDIHRKRSIAKRAGLSLTMSAVAAACCREYCVCLHELACFVSRYYLLLTLPAAIVWPYFGAAIWGGHIGVGAVEFFIKRPAMNICGFIFYFTLEQCSYQAGVWLGCFRCWFFAPVFPAIKMIIPRMRRKRALRPPGLRKGPGSSGFSYKGEQQPNMPPQGGASLSQR